MNEERQKQMAEATERWRAVLVAYKTLQDRHKVFCTAAELVELDYAGPGLSEALVRLFHRRSFQMFMEDLMFEDFRKGGVSQLTPPKSSTEEKKGDSGKESKYS